MADLRFEQRWLVVDVATDADLGEWEGVHQVCDPNRAATYMRVGRHRYRWEFQLRGDETADDYRDIDALHPLLRPWTKDIPVEALEVVRTAEYTFRARIADRWRDRRVFLLGDAAHLTPPFVGQGLGRRAPRRRQPRLEARRRPRAGPCHTTRSTATRPNASRTPAP